MRILILSCLVSFALGTHAQDWPYSLSAVPDSLKEKANTIVHLSNLDLEVESPDKATLVTHEVFTVLNEDGRHALFFNEHSSRYVTLGDVEIKVYDQNGKQIQKYKRKDLMTSSVGEGLVEDGFVNYLPISVNAYPVTVEWKYEQKFKSSFFPSYYFIGAMQGIVSSSYTISLPQTMDLRYKGRHTSIKPEIVDEGKYRKYKWSVSNLPPMQYEEGTVSARSRFPHVDIVTDQFSYYGHRGDLSSWKSFGAWIGSLYEGLDELPDERRKFFADLVKNIPDEAGKVKRIYEYMQQNFRYVSIQLGIGGLKPFSAAFTDQKKYGDCKALSNYMKAALKAVGIRSHVAIINAQYNEEPVDPDFPANDFNHVILCVPSKDSIWLECTSSTADFGILGTFTENRNALLITEAGGILVATPQSDPAANTLYTYTTVNVEADLSVVSETKMEGAGEFRELLSALLKQNRDDQKKMLVKFMGYKQPDDFLLVTDSAAGQTILKMSVRKVHEFNAGDKYFISPRFNKIWSARLPSAQNRRTDFYFHHPFELRDTTVLVIPRSLKPDAMPKEKEIRSNYSYYRSKCWYNEKEHAVYTATTLLLKRHKIPARDYGIVKSFFDEVMQDDSQRIVVKKSAEADPPPKKAF